MEFTVNKLKLLLLKSEDYFDITTEETLAFKPGPDQWSKKEILGHLIDSALHNLVRFTESTDSPKPYKYRPYDQDALVETNKYQSALTSELFQLWYSLNTQIIRIIESRTSEELEATIELHDLSIVNLRYLMADYPDHMEHHINQIIQ